MCHDNASTLAKPEDAQDEHHNHDETDDVDDIVHDWSLSLHRPKTIVRVRTIWRDKLVARADVPRYDQFRPKHLLVAPLGSAGANLGTGLASRNPCVDSRRRRKQASRRLSPPSGTQRKFNGYPS
jgi:hypothetical protein